MTYFVMPQIKRNIESNNARSNADYETMDVEAQLEEKNGKCKVLPVK